IDPQLSSDITLTSDLSRAVKNADLVMVISDHADYHNITSEKLNGAPVYDGRGILDISRFTPGRFASLGRPR
ncbi:MAG: UDP-glucose/GDP-mannose dehydrogenase family protein, partial [Thermoproteota archaeon]|nr:UDP-glucose/GDP-mannose dehydrogenase family protein [Thermoproteota archaeon]